MASDALIRAMEAVAEYDELTLSGAVLNGFRAALDPTDEAMVEAGIFTLQRIALEAVAVGSAPEVGEVVRDLIIAIRDHITGEGA
jgi:hypothetical protein